MTTPTTTQHATPCQPVQIPEEMRGEVSSTFTHLCAWGCVIRTVETAQQPHVCVGEQLIGAVLPDLVFGDAKLLAERLAPLVRGLQADAWDDGRQAGRVEQLREAADVLHDRAEVLGRRPAATPTV